jgi:hypothetical protein
VADAPSREKRLIERPVHATDSAPRGVGEHAVQGLQERDEAHPGQEAHQLRAGWAEWAGWAGDMRRSLCIVMRLRTATRAWLLSATTHRPAQVMRVGEATGETCKVAEICLCNVCSCQEILRAARTGGGPRPLRGGLLRYALRINARSWDKH